MVFTRINVGHGIQVSLVVGGQHLTGSDMILDSWGSSMDPSCSDPPGGNYVSYWSGLDPGRYTLEAWYQNEFGYVIDSSHGRIPDFPVTRSHPPASGPSAANSSICRTYRKGLSRSLLNFG